MNLLLLLLLQDPSVDEIIDKMEARVAPLKDIRFDYSTLVPLDDPESAGLAWRVRLLHRRETGLRIEAHRPSGPKLPALDVRYVYTADHLSYSFLSQDHDSKGEGLPLAALQFRIGLKDPAFRKIDPFLMPLEWPARLFFDDPLVLASVAPKRILSLENRLRLLGKRDSCWVLESEQSFLDFARDRGTARFGVASSRRRWFVDPETWRLVRVEFDFAMNRKDEDQPLLVSRAVDWQDAAGVSIPKTVEVGHGERQRDGSARIDRRFTKRIDSVVANGGLAEDRILPTWERDDLYADAILRKPEFYAARAKKDASAHYSWLISSLISGELLAGFWGRGRRYVEPEKIGEALLKAYAGRPDSTVLQRCLFAYCEDQKQDDLAGELLGKLKNPAPPVAVWLVARHPDLDVAVGELGLADEEQSILVGIRMRKDPSIFAAAMGARDFGAQLALLRTLAERFDDLKIPADVPLVRFVWADRSDEDDTRVEALLHLAKSDPAAAEFAIGRLHEWIESWEPEDLAKRATLLFETLDAVAPHRKGDPFVSALRGELAHKLGKDAGEPFAEALKRARESRVPESAFRAVIEAAVYYSDKGQEEKLVEAAELFLKLAATIGRPSARVFNDEKRSPVLLLTRLYCEKKKFTELYRALRGVDWNAYRYFFGVHGVLQRQDCVMQFVRAAKEECLSGRDVKEHAALARLLAKQLGKPDHALAVIEKARGLDPKNVELCLLQAETALRTRNADLAVQAYRESLALDANEAVGAHLAIAEIEIARKNPEAARADLTALDVTKLGAEPAERAARAFAAIGDAERAIAAYLRAESFGRAFNLPLGRLYEATKNWDEAMRRYNRAIAGGENDPGVRIVNPNQETTGEKARRLLLVKVGESYFRDRLFSEKFEPLTDEEAKKVEECLGRLADEPEEALEGLRAIGKRATPLLKNRLNNPDLKALLDEFAEPR